MSRIDPNETVATGSYRIVRLAMHLRKFKRSRDYLIAEGDVHRQKR
jgi:hypothetical protein